MKFSNFFRVSSFVPYKYKILKFTTKLSIPESEIMH